MDLDFIAEFHPCYDETGSLPPCAPLAVPFVPMQQNNPKMYPPHQALCNGTLFPGLNLPFRMKKEPRTMAEGAACELQALLFVLTELGLYLDTHQQDREAFQLFQRYAKLAEEGKRRYEAAYGPLTQASAANFQEYIWLSDPWPWEYCQEGGRK